MGSCGLGGLGALGVLEGLGGLRKVGPGLGRFEHAWEALISLGQPRETGGAAVNLMDQSRLGRTAEIRGLANYANLIDLCSPAEWELKLELSCLST